MVKVVTAETPGDDGDPEHPARWAAAPAAAQRITPVTARRAGRDDLVAAASGIGQPETATLGTGQAAPSVVGTGQATAAAPGTGPATPAATGIGQTTTGAADDGHEPAEDGFAEFYREAYPRLVGRAITRGLSRHDAADAAQDALVGVYKRWAMLCPQPSESRLRYASTALENAVQNVRRRWVRDADLSERLSSFVRFDEDDDGDTDALDLVRGLPKRQRAVILLLGEGWSANEIATRLRIGATSVRTHLQHARKTLRPKLEARKESDRG
ncbi:hypothetical protein Areg01_79130 [Actinoplanes regularis]|nr:hypothetical protein Areg01_79130 [Actinoplanes regularis]